MDIILSKILLKEENKTITKKDLINENFDYDIIMNEIKFSNNMTLKNEIILFILLNKYTNLKEMFHDCSLLTSIILSNFNTNNVTDMTNISVFVIH